LNYSEIAIDLGRKREKEFHDEERRKGMHTASSNSSNFMHLDAVDLLDHKSFLNTCKSGTYSAIIDKSTSDSIACLDEICVQLPHHVDVRSDNSVNLDLRQPPQLIHPLHVMAVHLALVTKPGGRWIALSYSNNRFPFVDGLYSSRPHITGFPDTGTLWRLQDKGEVESADEKTASRPGDSSVTHRPRVRNWVYELERTEIPLSIRGAHL
ncbi:hypothetical protein GQ44DRAFT_633196, partial [Phaeosphaeriaceae sp. PMI808]